MKRVLFICPYPENVAPSQRLKFEQYYDIFRQNNIQVETSSFVSKKFWKLIYKRGYFFSKVFYTSLGYWNRFRFLFKLSRFDIVYIHLWVTPLGPSLFEWLYRKLSKKVVYDIDDLIYLRNNKSKSNPIISWVKGRGKPIYLMKTSDHVITCTPYLDEFVRRYNLNTTDISSTVDTDRYLPKVSYQSPGGCIVGWSGSHSTSKYLHLLDRVFQKLASEYRFKLLVMGDKEFSIEGVDVEAIEWSETYEIETIKRFTIGVYPLPDEEWVLGKSGLKAIQYMAMGIPTVATAVGANFRVIEDNISGFLVKEESEWYERLTQLINNVELRQSIGQNARKRVEDLFSLKANAPAYLKILENI